MLTHISFEGLIWLTALLALALADAAVARSGGLCLIGTIVDLVNHQKLAFEYNQKMANEVLSMVR